MMIQAFKRVLGATLLLLTLNGTALAATGPRTLVLYDTHPTDPMAKLGLSYAIMLRNLLGHFEADVTLQPVEDYQSGAVDSFDATFYIGAYYDNDLPASFLADASQTNSRLIWFRSNLWKLAWDPAYNFEQTRGIRFHGQVGMNALPDATNANPGFYDTVVYKGKPLVKYYDYDPANNTIYADPFIGITSVVNTALAEQVVAVENSGNKASAPYVLRSGNFWYYADMPFSYIGPRDRYLVIADLLHDMLGVDHPEQHLAMVRLEDVGALVNPANMKKLVDHLKQEKIEFSIGAFPVYRDPLGVYNGGVAQEIHMADSPALLEALRYATTRGGNLTLHGYTHQYGSQANPHTGVSGDDFEFWDIVANTPVPEDSEAWVLDRLDAGIAEYRANGFSAYAWVTPHYQASATASRAFPKRFNKTYNRVVYYTNDNPDLDVNSPNRDFSFGQFYPYEIFEDYYGQRVLPENLGNIEYDISHIDPTSNFDYSWETLVGNAEHALLIRDGFASFFFHPFWLERALGTPGEQDFKSLVQGINKLGFTWVAGSSL